MAVRSLKAVLSLRFVAICLLPGLVLAVLIWATLVPQMERRVIDAHGTLSEMLAVEAERYLQQPVAALRGLAAVISAMPESERDILSGRLLQAQLLGSGTLAGAFIIDASGRLTDIALPADTGKLPATYLGLDLSANPVASPVHRSGQQLWSAVYLSGVTEQITVAATVPIGTRLLVGEIRLEQLSAFVRKVSGRTSMRVMIVDGRGQVVAHPDPLIARQQLNIGLLPILQQAARADATMVTSAFEFEGVPVIGAARKIAETDWFVMIVEPLAEVRRPVWEILAALLLAALIAAVLAVVMGVIMAEGFARRFALLSELAEGLAAGRYPDFWPESNVAEANALIGSVRRMADAVRHREMDLQQLNAELESRVAERTEELQRSNLELSTAMETLEQTQAELLQSEKLAALGSLVAGVAHELNTPIGNSLMVASTLQDKTEEFERNLAGGLTRSALNRHLDTNREASASLVRNLQRAGDLIASFKQVAVDQTTSQRRRFLLGEVVREIVLTLSPMLRNSPYQIRVEIPDGIVMDSFPGPLGQVLTNLISNALVHAFDGRQQGVVRVSGMATEDGENIVLSVIDDGVGIASEFVGRVFDPFFTTRMGRGGTGLGLSICHNIVEGVLGGHIAVSSTLGEGTTFAMTLPTSAPQHAVVGECGR